MKECCRQPFTAIEIGDGGDIYTCCPSFINNYKIGNIFDNNVDEIWYSDSAIHLRERILNGDYSLCNETICRQYQPKIDEKNYTSKPPFPTYVTLAYDRECNLKCITCRDNKIKNSKEELEKYNKRIEQVLIPLLKNAKILALSGGGEALYSSHSRLLIKKIAKENKDLLFNINTNGILFNESNLKELGILGRINEVFVSLPALNEKLYKNIMIDSDFKTVIKNIKWMAKEQEKSIKKITINSVISKLNYKEIPQLIQFAKDLNIFITLSPFDDWGTKFAKEYDWEIWNKRNSEYTEFEQIMKKIPSYNRVYMPKLFYDLTVK